MNPGDKIKVLIVDDSAIVRRLLTDALSVEADIEVVGTASDPFIARDKILALHPDVLTLDIDMPRMDGLTFLKRLMRFHPLPVIIVSSMGIASSRVALEALESGAIDVLAKPSGPQSVGHLHDDLASKIRAASVARPRNRVGLHPVASEPKRPTVIASKGFPAAAIIAIGASTGGTEAIQKVLVDIPENSPPILVVQHIPAFFSRSFADRLNDICRIRVREAQDGDKPEPGLALIAPGNLHMVLARSAYGYQVEVKGGPLVCYQRPAVDVLFQSVARAAGPHATGVILTGMGSDGALGLAAMKAAGARTIAQDEASCVVFGMPKEAIRRGTVDRVLPLLEIPGAMLAEACRAS